MLEVSAEIIKRQGAVSEEVASSMAIGAQKRFGSNLSISFTGVAGPDGGSPEKPVGTVWCGLCYDDRVYTKLLSLSGSRHDIRWQASFETLEWLEQTIRANHS